MRSWVDERGYVNHAKPLHNSDMDSVDLIIFLA